MAAQDEATLAGLIANAIVGNEGLGRFEVNFGPAAGGAASSKAVITGYDSGFEIFIGSGSCDDLRERDYLT